MADPAPPLPTFLIIGAQKSATRWLRMNLGEHPEVFAVDRELSYFNSRPKIRRLGLDWYRSQFEGWSGQPIVGEATPGYMIHRHKPGRMAKAIREVVPDVRLIAILRNPVDRAQSALIHHVEQERLPPSSRLVDFASATPPEDERLNIIAGGWYAASLRPFRKWFGDQLLVLLHDDIAADADEVYRRSLRHIGADDSFRPKGLTRVRHSNARRTPVIPPLTDDERLLLWDRYFADDVSQLEKLIGRDLSAWRPEGSASADHVGVATRRPAT
ncbi:MAG: sulfotransferase [Acidimicrobiia bacterium]|nr:sulfotransferase [Acidimicrobiia bacterium]